MLGFFDFDRVHFIVLQFHVHGTNTNQTMVVNYGGEKMTMVRKFFFYFSFLQTLQWICYRQEMASRTNHLVEQTTTTSLMFTDINGSTNKPPYHRVFFVLKSVVHFG